ncbi:MAG: pantetheine-phosphate adenylyltransferase [Lentisphaerae bacterium GWF2_52_8]|nr:MAG: pantetheine-phosphate adenylyltransferase [Lentisphaerae bacterium GWF2_52_8]
MVPKKVLYPGSFDPVTNGHLDVIGRAARLFDTVIVAIAGNAEKNPLFSAEERIALLRESCAVWPNVQLVSFEGLLVNAVSQFEASAVIRGLRAVSDFEYEFQMALMNRELNNSCETIFMMPSPSYSFVSSRLIKEIASCNGDVSAFVPPKVAKELSLKFHGGKR